MTATPLHAARNRYPVVWREDGQEPAAGELVVDRDVLRFYGVRSGDPVEARLRFAEVRAVRVARRKGERLNDRATIVLDRGAAGPFLVGPLGAGLLGEITALLTVLHEEGTIRAEHVAVLVPLRRGTAATVRELVAEGPPFDLEAAGIRQHEVYVGDREAVFVFRGPDVRSVLEHALSDPAFWKAGLAWRNVLAGRPQLLDSAFGWTAPVDAREF